MESKKTTNCGAMVSSGGGHRPSVWQLPASLPQTKVLNLTKRNQKFYFNSTESTSATSTSPMSSKVNMPLSTAKVPDTNKAELTEILKNLGQVGKASGVSGRVDKKLRHKREVSLPSTVSRDEISSLVEVVKVLGNKLDRLTINQKKLQGAPKVQSNRTQGAVNASNRSDKTLNLGHINPPGPKLAPITSAACVGCVAKSQQIAKLENELFVKTSLADGIVFQLRCDVEDADNRASNVDCENDTLKRVVHDVELELANQKKENAKLIQSNEALTQENARLLDVNESALVGEQSQQRYADQVLVNETLRQQNADLVKSNDTLKMQSTVTAKRIAATKILIRRLGEENTRLSKFKGNNKFELCDKSSVLLLFWFHFLLRSIQNMCPASRVPP